MKALLLQALHLLLANLPLVVGGLVSLLGLLLGKDEVRRRRVAKAAHLASLAARSVESELSPEAAAKFDPIAHALKLADDYMLAHGWRGLDDSEKAAAEIQARATHGSGLTSIPAEVLQ